MAPTPAEHEAFMRAKWEKFPRLTSNRPKVLLMGDSVLDDFYWLVDETRSLRVVLEEGLRACHVEGTAPMGGAEPWAALNLAVDQMTTHDFLDRGQNNSWRGYQIARERAHRHAGGDELDCDGYRHLCGPDGHIRSAANASYLKNVQYIFLSIGGNDVYLDASVQTALARSLLPFCDARGPVADAMLERVERIVEALRKACPQAKIVPVVVYHPHHAFSIAGGVSCGGLVETVQRRYLAWMVTPLVRCLLKVAQREGLDVIDLSQTFDPNNARHYGTMDTKRCGWSGAEPSDVSHCFTARLMVDVISSRAQREAAGGVPAPRIFYGRVDGDDYKETLSAELTEAYVKAYTFHHGVKEGKKKAGSKSSKKPSKRPCAKA